ncbi:MAG: carboxymuconolactone decarboxylase family protein [Pseudomonadota bacterium]
MTDAKPISALERGRELSEKVMPGLEAALAKRYDRYVPGFSTWQIATVYGGVYGRDGLDLRTRQLCTIASLATIGGQATPQLKVHVRAARTMGIEQREISEAILQMALYGGFPAMINALNAAIEVFEEEEPADA